VRDALESLFSSLPASELPPPRAAEPVEEAPATAPPAADDPSQMSLFTGKGAAKGQPKAGKPPKAGPAHPGLSDPLYAKAVAAAIERGSASVVHLTRALEVGHARASSLVDAMVVDGVLGEVTASGSRPVILSDRERAARSRA
jgi:DNA segregation ATPase FtsK/SpoIIIE-like protein